MKAKPRIAWDYSQRNMAEPERLLQSKSFTACLEQAELCCEQARQAARARRFKAACGLFTTASDLYRRALNLDSASYPAVENRLRAIEVEINTNTELAKDMVQRITAKPGHNPFK
ncbi:MAG: hypothetical protein JO316_03010 [Abitibacteriaceae bacterium]|nr:hypothetical protein [Abditibacteriaceae bacterium]MBV9864300.1 hypothetical protein [Abditibacteriaceae bacterium]